MKKTHIIAVANQKGGTGKTSVTHNLGTNLARQGKKVLVVDLDPQANLTMCMGFDQPDDLSCTMAHIFKGLIDETFAFQKEEYILHAERCDLIPSSIQLSGIEPSLANAMSRENLLKRLLSQLKDEYDYILVDCAPSLGLLTINALAAATSILVPVQAHYIHISIPFVGTQRIPDPIYWWIYEPIYMSGMRGNGTCCGISATSLRFYHGADIRDYDPTAIYPIAVTDPGKPAVYDTSSTPHKPQNLWAVIRVNHGVQKSAEYMDAWLGQSQSTSYRGDPAARYRELVNGNPLDYVVRLRFGGKGHIVVPYAAKDNKIYVYDCNYPNQICAINIDIAANTYEYNGWSGNQLFTIPISIWAEPRHMPGLDTLWDWMVAAVDGAGTITTSTGSMGIDAAGNFKEDNPEGWVLVPDETAGYVNSFGLLMKDTAEPPIVQVDVGNKDFDFFVSKKGRLFQLEINDPDGCDAGKLQLDQENGLPTALQYSTAGSTSNIVPKLGIVEDGKTIVFSWSGVDVENGKLECGLAGTDGAQYQNTGSASKFILVVNSVNKKPVDENDEVYGTYLYGPFEIPAGAIHKTTLKNWPDCSVLLSEIDLNADGITDVVNKEVPGIKLDTPLNEQSDEDNNGIPDQFNMQQVQTDVSHMAADVKGTQPAAVYNAAEVSGSASVWDTLVWAIPVFAVAVAGVIVVLVLIRKGKIGRMKNK